MTLIGFTVACVAFGAVAVAYGSFPDLVRLRSADALVLALLAPAAVATALPLAPTGVALWDAALLAGFTVGLGVAAAAADRRLLLLAVVAVTAMAVAGDGGILAAGAALGTAGAVAALGFRLPAPKAFAGACTALALVGLRWPAGETSRLAVGAALVSVLAAAALARASTRARRRVVAGGAALLVAGGIAAGLYGVHALAARDELERAADLARRGLDAARDGRIEDATAALASAERDFADARRRLDRWSARPARFVPGLAQNGRALHTIASTGERLAAASVDVSSEVDIDDLRLRRGVLDLEQVVAARRGLAALAGLLDDAGAALADARGPLLVPVVDDALDDLDGEVAAAGESTSITLEVLRVLPELLGADGPRRWFLGLQGVSEARATGGIIGSSGILTTDAGRISLGPLGRTAELNSAGDPSTRTLIGPPDYVARYRRYQVERVWQNVTLSPDGPSVAQVVEGLYPQSGGVEVDGVVLVDHVALAALLQLTGPVEVETWPEPLTAENVAGILLHEQYLRYPRPERVDFLADAARGVFDRLTAGDLPAPDRLIEVFADAVAGRHLLLHSTDARQQALFKRLALDGALPPVQSDFLALVTQNASGNKIDWFLRRSLTYDATVGADGGVDAELTVRLHNGAPASGLPHYVIGGVGEEPTADGENRMLFSVYTPLGLEGATIDGRPLELRTERELGRNVHETRITVPPGGNATVVLRLRGTVDVADGYVLDVRAQPTVVPDDVEVVLDGEGVTPTVERVRADRDRRIRG